MHSSFKSLLGEGGAGSPARVAQEDVEVGKFQIALGRGGCRKPTSARVRASWASFKSLLGEGGAGRQGQQGVARLVQVSNRSWARGVPEGYGSLGESRLIKVSNRSWARGVPEGVIVSTYQSANMFQIALGRGGCRKVPSTRTPPAGCFKSLLGEGGAGSSWSGGMPAFVKFQIALGRGGCRKRHRPARRRHGPCFKSLLGEGGAGSRHEPR